MLDFLQKFHENGFSMKSDFFMKSNFYTWKVTFPWKVSFSLKVIFLLIFLWKVTLYFATGFHGFTLQSVILWQRNSSLDASCKKYAIALYLFLVTRYIFKIFEILNFTLFSKFLFDVIKISKKSKTSKMYKIYLPISKYKKSGISESDK